MTRHSKRRESKRINRSIWTRARVRHGLSLTLRPHLLPCDFATQLCRSAVSCRLARPLYYIQRWFFLNWLPCACWMSSIFCWHVILSGAIFFLSANVVPDAKVTREARGDVALKRSATTRPCPRSIARDTYATRYPSAMRTWAKRSTSSLVAHHRPARWLIWFAFITGNSSLEPLIEGLCAQIHVDLRWRVFGRNRTGDLTDY